MQHLSTFSVFFLFCTGEINALLINQPTTIQSVVLGHTVTIECYLPKTDFNSMAWYKQELGMMPVLIVKGYNYLKDVQFSDGFKKDHFIVSSGKGIFHLTIYTATHEDTAVYFCGLVILNELRFGSGTFLMVKGVSLSRQRIIQLPVIDVLQGYNVSLQCIVEIVEPHCAGEHSVYWYRHGSEESHPGIIYTHGGSSDQCNKSSDAGISKQSCLYNLLKRNLSTTDAGIYYCAVEICGEILFGNGTSLSITDNNTPAHYQSLFFILVVSNVISVLLIILILVIRRIKQSHSSGSSNCEMQTVQADYDEALNYAAVHFTSNPQSSGGTRRQQMLQDTHVYSQVKYNQQR